MRAAKDENGDPVRPRVAVSDESTNHLETAPTLSNFFKQIASYLKPIGLYEL
jgi:hypothetical protein